VIPVDARLDAPPGYLLVEREEMPLRRGRIHIPAAIRMSTRSCEAVVRSVGVRADDSFAEGDRVFLAAGAGRAIKLGLRGERTLYRIEPSVVLARIVGEAATGIESKGIQPQAIADWEIEAASAIDEGEPEALR
jgi:hypothetical protein